MALSFKKKQRRCLENTEHYQRHLMANAFKRSYYSAEMLHLFPFEQQPKKSLVYRSKSKQPQRKMLNIQRSRQYEASSKSRVRPWLTWLFSGFVFVVDCSLICRYCLFCGYIVIHHQFESCENVIKKYFRFLLSTMKARIHTHTCMQGEEARKKTSSQQTMPNKSEAKSEIKL